MIFRDCIQLLRHRIRSYCGCLSGVLILLIAADRASASSQSFDIMINSPPREPGFGTLTVTAPEGGLLKLEAFTNVYEAGATAVKWADVPEGEHVLEWSINERRRAVPVYINNDREKEIVLHQRPVPGMPWVSPATGMEFVWIEALQIWAAKYETTVNQYRHYKPRYRARPFEGFIMDAPRQPAIINDFNEAMAFTAWMTIEDYARGALADTNTWSYRLPTESEWETLAGCGTGREYPWGDEWPPVSGKAGNYADTVCEEKLGYIGVRGGYYDGYAVSCPVEQCWMNEWGLYGVGGNLWEPCVSDDYHDRPVAWRGGAWNRSSQRDLRIKSSRITQSAMRSDKRFGIRVMLVANDIQ